MRRREVIALLGSAAAWSFAAVGRARRAMNDRSRQIVHAVRCPLLLIPPTSLLPFLGFVLSVTLCSDYLRPGDCSGREGFYGTAPGEQK